jgi:hypothetical protein
MFTIGNNELKAPLERVTKCHMCGESVRIEDSGPSKVFNWQTQEWEDGPSGTLQFWTCCGKTFLAGIEGKAIPRRGE